MFLADNIGTVVVATHPSNGTQAVALGDTVWVLFNQEVDEWSLQEGNFFVTGQDNQTWSGPDMAMWVDPNGDQTDQNLLNSPAYDGVVPGTFSFQRISLTSSGQVATLDTIGSGILYRTKAIFTPDRPFSPNTTYKVFLLGDDDSGDSIVTGVRPRNVFDTLTVSGTGTASLSFTGTYTGSQPTDYYHVQVLSSGVRGGATFQWWTDSAPGTIYGPIATTERVLLSNGVYVDFSNTGLYKAFDHFKALVKQKNPFTGITFWSFDSGSGSVVALPTTVSTSVIGDLVPVTVIPADTTFTVKSITPADRATNLTITTHQIVVEFTSPIDPTTVNHQTVKLWGYPVNGDEMTLFGNREIFKDITVSGTKLILDF